MGKYDAFIDAYLKGDSLFRFVYVPSRNELFLEEELEEADNGQFLYVPFKDSQELFTLMANFYHEQDGELEQKLYEALSSPSPIKKFEKTMQELGLQQVWEEKKREYAKKHIVQWLMHYHIEL
jgi:hypothetical protein